MFRDPRAWLGLGLSGLFSWLAFKNANPALLIHTAKGATLGPIFLAFILAYVILLVRARRWGILMEGVVRPSIVSLFKAALLGFLGNYILPARAGEILRAIWLGARVSIRPSTIFATIALERLLDLYSILLMFGLIWVLRLIPQEQRSIREAIEAGAMLFVGVGVALAALLWLWRFHTQFFMTVVRKTIGRISSRLGSAVLRGLDGFSQGLKLPKGWNKVGEVLLWTCSIWGLSAYVVVLVAKGLGLEVPWQASLVVLVALGLGVSLPSAPGFVGTFHYAAMGSVMLYGVGEAQALSFAMVLHGVCIAPVLVLGIPLLLKEGLSLSGVWHMGKKMMSLPDSRKGLQHRDQPG